MVKAPQAVVRLAHAVILSDGWRRRAIAFFGGAVGALAMAPFDVFPALIVPMTVGVWLIDGCFGPSAGQAPRARALAGDLRAAAVVGWWLGFGYFVAGLWWLGAAFLVDADQFAWALPLGVLGLPAALAIFFAFGFMLARLLWSTGAARVLAFAFALGCSEWLRGTILTGFPWNDLGMALGGNLVLAQLASLVGLHGLTFVAVAMAAAPATLADERKSAAAGTLLRLADPLVAAGLALVAIAAFGGLRLSAHPTEFAPSVRLRIMQPNVPLDASFRPDNGEKILERYLRLSDRATSPGSNGIASVTHLVWPESAFPFILSENAEALGKIGAFLPRGTVLVTGAARREIRQVGTGSRRGPHADYFNSIQVIESGGQISATYDKVHLVPFGEYLPLGGLLERIGLRQFVHIPGGFEPGRTRALLPVPGLPPVAPLVCYEAIFSGEVLPPGRLDERPALMLNVTEDGWYGRTPGPYQHFAQARLRTVEEGLPLVRAANTGISAVVDAYGRIVATAPLGIETVVDSALPRPGRATVYSRNRLAVPGGLAVLMLIASILLRRRRFVSG